MSLINTYHFISSHPLTRDNKISAIMRWVKWQLGSRLVPGLVAMPFVDNMRLLVKPGMTGATGNIYCGLHEFEDMAFILHFLRPGDLFVDVGANIGSYTVLASAAGAKVISFEPVPASYEALIDNIQINRISTLVDARNQALGGEEGSLEMIADQDTTNRVVHEREIYSGETVKVPATALDKALYEKSPKMIKLDVEGFETEVLSGACDVISGNDLQAVIIELDGNGERYGYDENQLHEQMLSLGFCACIYEPMQRKITDLKGGRSMVGNTLYLKDPLQAQSVVTESHEYYVQGVSI